MKTPNLVLQLTLLTSFVFASTTFAQDRGGEVFRDLFDRIGERVAAQAGPMGPIFGKLSPDQIARLDQIEISKREEEKFGSKVLQEFTAQCERDQIRLLQQGKDVQYIQQLCDQIKPIMRHADRYRMIRVILIETENEDGFSIPGGTVLITRGLLENAGSEAALVGVLAHE